MSEGGGATSRRGNAWCFRYRVNRATDRPTIYGARNTGPENITGRTTIVRRGPFRVHVKNEFIGQERWLSHPIVALSRRIRNSPGEGGGAISDPDFESGVL